MYRLSNFYEFNVELICTSVFIKRESKLREAVWANAIWAP